MGVRAVLYRVDPRVLGFCVEVPGLFELLSEFEGTDLGQLIDTGEHGDVPLAKLKAIEEARNGPIEIPAYDSFDKALPGLHYLLASAMPEERESLAPLEVMTGHKSAHVVSVPSDQTGPVYPIPHWLVRRIAGLFHYATADDRTRAFRPKAMLEARVYPEIWNQDDAVDWLEEYWPKLERVFDDAALAGEAVIVSMSV